MYGLNENTHIYVPIDKLKLLTSFNFHFIHKVKIERVVKNLIITNQIEAYKYIENNENGKIEKNKKDIFFVNITMLNYTNVDVYDTYGYINKNMSLLVDIYKQINRDIFLTIVDIDGNPWIIFYRKSNMFYCAHIPIDFTIELEDKKINKMDFDTTYRDIISQI